MSNTASSNSPSRTPEAATTRKVGRPPVVLTADTWKSVTEALASKTDLPSLATVAGVSVPTARKLLAAKFGDRIVFARGRTGGVTLQAARRGGKGGKAPKIL